MEDAKKLQLGLLVLRLTIFVVMLMWTVDKLIRPEHASLVYAHFYFIEGLTSEVMYVLGSIELVLIVFFLVGILKTISYGFIFVIHSVSTFSSFKQYLAPYDEVNLLFFAAWPMWGACLLLFLLRDKDTALSIT